tara:strand:+ start:75 stop:749 length:675 start_codon:yes stop_codon:yes gene_type:complete
MRISKFIAHAGLCSRREAEKLIINRKVKINEKLCEDLSYKVKDTDKVVIGGKKINLQSSVNIYILNKPRGYITSKIGQKQRKTVYDLLPKNKQNLITIGRLDYNTEGLLLFTNNGDIAREYELPKNKIKRTYRVKVFGSIKDSYIEKIKHGVKIDGITHKVDNITLIKKLKTNNWFKIELSEGKNREIRKIFKKFDLTVNRIVRTNYGEYSIGKMKSGEFKKIK